MPEEPADEPADDAEPSGGVFTGFGVASAALGAVAVAAVVLATLIWIGHHDQVEERRYQSRVLQTAAEWTTTLVNMNKDTVAADLTRLHEGTIGELNSDFDATVEPYRKLVQTLQSRTTGQVDSVSIETLHHVDGGAAAPPPPNPELSAFAARTDTVLVVATSVSADAGQQQPRTVRWTLRLDVSDVEGKLMISRLEPIR
jgi:hypothetical protein